MKKVILQFQGVLHVDELQRLEEELKRDLEHNGFIVIDEKFRVIELDDTKED